MVSWPKCLEQLMTDAEPPVASKHKPMSVARQEQETFLRQQRTIEADQRRVDTSLGCKW